jgi:hypothetical protein
MTVYFMGGELSAFTPSATSPAETTTSSAPFSVSFSRCAIDCGASAIDYVETPALTLPDELYTHTYFKRRTSYGGTYSLLSYLAGATEVFRVRTTPTTIQMQALITGVMTNVGASIPINPEDIAEHLDVHFQGNDATGEVGLYLGGTEKTTATVDLSSVTGIDTVQSYHPHRFSQMVIADEPTIGGRLFTRHPNGAGGTSNWTGGFGDVDEIVRSDVDFCNSSTNGQIEFFTQTGPAVDGYTVRAVGVYARAKRGASGPSNLQLGLKVGATEDFSASNALGLGYAAVGNIWEQNPATAAAWLSAAIDTIQPGMKAVT